MHDADLMRRALALAAKGRGRVEPNPMVGCVLVRDGRIIAEGYHEYFGGPHAEPNALAKCPDATGATAYLTLEPCTEYPGKKTPACTTALIAAKVARVVAACGDPNPKVSGAGFARLTAAGIDVHQGLLEKEARQLNAAFFKRAGSARPYVTLKWAQTADGKIAGPGGKRLIISNPASLAAMHRLRSISDAILVGIGTVLSDDPMLATRAVNPPRVPIRIVLDTNLRIDPNRQLVKTARELPLAVYCGEKAFQHKIELVRQLTNAGATVISSPVDESNRISLPHLLNGLGKRNITHLFVEPGVELAKSFLQQNLADRLWITKSPRRVNAPDAPDAPTVDYPISGKIHFNGDELAEHLNPASPVYFSLQPSADLRMISGE